MKWSEFRKIGDELAASSGIDPDVVIEDRDNWNVQAELRLEKLIPGHGCFTMPRGDENDHLARPTLFVGY